MFWKFMFLEYTDRNIGVFIQKTGLSIVMYDQWIRMTGIGKCHDSGIDIYNPDKDRGVYIVVGIVTHMFVDQIADLCCRSIIAGDIAE